MRGKGIDGDVRRSEPLTEIRSSNLRLMLTMRDSLASI